MRKKNPSYTALLKTYRIKWSYTIIWQVRVDTMMDHCKVDHQCQEFPDYFSKNKWRNTNLSKITILVGPFWLQAACWMMTINTSFYLLIIFIDWNLLPVQFKISFLIIFRNLTFSKIMSNFCQSGIIYLLSTHERKNSITKLMLIHMLSYTY